MPERRLNRFVDGHSAEILSECINIAREAFTRISANEPVLDEDFRLANFAACGSVIAEVIDGETGKRDLLNGPVPYPPSAWLSRRRRTLCWRL